MSMGLPDTNDILFPIATAFGRAQRPGTDPVPKFVTKPFSNGHRQHRALSDAGRYDCRWRLPGGPSVGHLLLAAALP